MRASSLRLHQARTEAQEHNSWTCKSCTKMIEEGEPGPYCAACRQYWTDVENGMFDYD